MYKNEDGTLSFWSPEERVSRYITSYKPRRYRCTPSTDWGITYYGRGL